MARQTLFTEELFERMLDLHAAGGEQATIRAICRLEGMPAPRTFYEWIAGDPKLELRFKAARRAAMDGTAEEILEISDTPEVGVIEKLERVPIPFTEAEKAAERAVPGSVERRYEEVVVERRREDMLGHRRLKVDARFKLLSKWDTRYGDRLAIAGDADQPLTVVVRKLTDP